MVQARRLRRPFCIDPSKRIPTSSIWRTAMATRPSLMIVTVTAVSFMLMAAQAEAQTASSDTSMSANPTKAQRKEARKQARAHKNAELKKLEQNGYNPSRNNVNYPDDIQKAEKKAGAANGASQ
ncbi:MAG TPA: DUF4148 domain-containing protein [Paraburkholderia sp.]|nr:DUF4148 domain-containing protein [Paraburkholderia sp.]